MKEKVLIATSVVIVILAAGLLLTSAVNLFVALGDIVPLQTIQLFGGRALVLLSMILAGVNFLWGGHPMYEYWVVVMGGSIVGAIYAA